MSYNIHALACTGSAMIQFPFSGTCLQRKSKIVHLIVQIYDEVYVEKHMNMWVRIVKIGSDIWTNIPY